MNGSDRAVIGIGALVILATAAAMNARFAGAAPLTSTASVTAAARRSAETPTHRRYEPESSLPPLAANDMAVGDPTDTSSLNGGFGGVGSTVPGVSASTSGAATSATAPSDNPYVASQDDPTRQSPYQLTLPGDAPTLNPYGDTSDSALSSAYVPDDGSASADVSAMPNDASDQELLDRMMTTLTPEERDDFRTAWWTMNADERQEWMLYLRYTLGDVQRDPSSISGSN